MLSTGRRIAEYEILSFLGQGGMGQVYRARDPQNDRDVALKILLPDVATDADRLRRFVQEAKSAASIDHPNVAGIHQIGQTDGVHFIAMEYVEGQTLQRRIETAAIPEDELLRIAIQVADGLNAAHQMHLVHRDLKPANIMLTPDGRAKLLDFGLAKTIVADSYSETISRQTEFGTILGTVSYMSPEQALGGHIDHRADIFSLGVVLYELATGRLPFAGLTAIQTINQIINTEPAPVSTHNPEISPGLERIIMKCLEKQAERRFQTASELSKDLQKPEPDTEFLTEARDAPNNLPQQLTRFIGRRRQIADVRRLLRDNRLVTLSGSGGIGKTRLSLQVAADSLKTFSDGVWFVDLGSLTDGTLVPQIVAATLNVREQPGQILIDTIADYLKAKNLLLVLDNCEHLVDACAQLAEALLRACGNLRILATTRDLLAIPGEAVFNVPTLGLPDHDGPSGNESSAQPEAIELFADRARLVQPAFAAGKENVAILSKICRQLDGIPLAIELAASQVRIFSLEEIAARLEDQLGLLMGRSRTALPRHQTLLAAIDWSYNLLNDAEQTLFRRLSIFAGGWTPEAAEAICSDNGLEAATVSGILSQLVDKSLVLPEPGDGQQRLRFLATLAKYAAKKLKGTKESRMLRRRHATFFLKLAEEASPNLWGPGLTVWLGRLNLEHDNMRALLSWSLKNDPEASLRTATALGRFWSLRSHLQEARQWFSQTLEGSGSVSAALRAQALNESSGNEFGLGDYSAALTQSTEALSLCREVGDKRGIAAALRVQGLLAQRRGDQAEAFRFCEECLSIQRELGNQPGIAAALNNLGILSYRTSQYERAQTYYEESLQIGRALGDKRSIAMALSNLGNVAMEQGDFARAESLQQESLALVRELGARNFIAVALLHLADVKIKLGEYRAAEVLIQESLTIYTEIGDKRGIGFAQVNSGQLAVAEGDYEKARPHIENGLAIFREIDDRRGIATALYLLGSGACLSGDYATARTSLDESLMAFNALENKDAAGLVLVEIAELARRQGEYETAQRLLQQALVTFQQLRSLANRLSPIESLGTVALGLGGYERAVVLWGATDALRQRMSAVRALGQRDSYERNLSTARLALGENAFAVLKARGETMPFEEVVAYALQDPDSPSS